MEQGKNFSDPGYYTFIEGSYIHGIMEGKRYCAPKGPHKGVFFEVDSVSTAMYTIVASILRKTEITKQRARSSAMRQVPAR